MVGIILGILAVLNLATLAASILNLAAASNFHDETKLYLDACVGDLCDDMEQLRTGVENRVDYQARLVRVWQTHELKKCKCWVEPETVEQKLAAKIEEVRQHSKAKK